MSPSLQFIINMNKLYILLIKAYVNLFYKHITINENILHIYCTNSDLNINSTRFKIIDIVREQKLSEETSLYLLRNFNICEVFESQKFKIPTEDIIYFSTRNVDFILFGCKHFCFRNYLKNNICSTEQLIEILKYDLEIFDFIPNPSQEVKDFYNLLNL